MLAYANPEDMPHTDILEKYRPRRKVSVVHPRYSLVHEGRPQLGRGGSRRLTDTGDPEVGWGDFGKIKPATMNRLISHWLNRGSGVSLSCNRTQKSPWLPTRWRK